MKKTAIILLCLLLMLPTAACKKTEPQCEQPTAPKDGVYVVGEHIHTTKITDFYYTVATSTYPPFYQRFRFYAEDGAYKFFHEIREGDHFPLTEADATVSETVTLTAEQWNEFLDCVDGGRVIARQENLDSGDDGPWLYLYWTGDPGDVQQFTFASYSARLAFEALSESLCNP